MLLSEGDDDYPGRMLERKQKQAFEADKHDLITHLQEVRHGLKSGLSIERPIGWIELLLLPERLGLRCSPFRIIEHGLAKDRKRVLVWHDRYGSASGEVVLSMKLSLNRTGMLVHRNLDDDVLANLVDLSEQWIRAVQQLVTPSSYPAAPALLPDGKKPELWIDPIWRNLDLCIDLLRAERLDWQGLEEGASKVARLYEARGGGPLHVMRWGTDSRGRIDTLIVRGPDGKSTKISTSETTIATGKRDVATGYLRGWQRQRSKDIRSRKRPRKPRSFDDIGLTEIQTKTLHALLDNRFNVAATARELGKDTKTVRDSLASFLRKNSTSIAELKRQFGGKPREYFWEHFPFTSGQ